MDFLDKLERRLGWLAVPGLVRVVVLMNALVYLLAVFNPGYIQALMLDPERVAAGEVWRLVSYIFIPPAAHPLFILFALLFFWRMGEGLEEAWGSFRLTVFYLVGMAGTTVAAFLTGGATTNAFLNLSLLFAFATLYPEFGILLLILPVKVKWVAWISLAMTLLVFVVSGWAMRLAILASLANYILFFGPKFLREKRERHQTAQRRARFEADKPAKGAPLHVCAGCGVTDVTRPDMDFRVAADGLDYCEECLTRARASRPS